MKKAERKARLKAKKQRAKLARAGGLAESAAADTASPATTPADVAPATDAAEAAPVAAAAPEANPAETGSGDSPVAAESPDAGAETPPAPAVLDDDALRYIRQQGAVKMAEARAAVAAAKAEYPQLDDDRARAMLVDAAEFLHEVVVETRAALAQVPPEQRREALAIINEKPEPSDVSAVKRPRRGPNPVVSLMRVGMQAASLLKRVLAATNPELGPLKHAV